MKLRPVLFGLAFWFLAGGLCVQAADDRLDVSQIIDKATAESVLGEPVKATSPRNLDGNDGYYSKCNYYSATSTRSLILRVYQAASAADVTAELESIRASTGAGKSVGNLGDQAEIFTGAESGLPNNVVLLYVVKGNWLVTVGICGVDDEIALDKSKRLAQQILTKIR